MSVFWAKPQTLQIKIYKKHFARKTYSYPPNDFVFQISDVFC